MIAFTPWEHVAERLNIFTAIVVKIQSQRKSVLILILNTFVVKGPGLASVLCERSATAIRIGVHQQCATPLASLFSMERERYRDATRCRLFG